MPSAAIFRGRTFEVPSPGTGSPGQVPSGPLAVWFRVALVSGGSTLALEPSVDTESLLTDRCCKISLRPTIVRRDESGYNHQDHRRGVVLVCASRIDMPGLRGGGKHNLATFQPMASTLSSPGQADGPQQPIFFSVIKPDRATLPVQHP